MSEDEKPKASVAISTIVDFAAALSPDAITNVENAAKAYAIDRRIVASILSKSAEELVRSGREIASRNPQEYEDTVLQISDRLEHYEEWLKAGLEAVQSAHARMFAVGEHVLSEVPA